METQDFLLSAANTSLAIPGQPQSNPFTTASDPLQLPGTHSNQSGSFTDPIGAGITETAMEVVEYNQSLHNKMLGLFGDMTEVAAEIVDQNQSLQDEVLDMFGGITEVTRGIVEYNQSLLEGISGEPAPDVPPVNSEVLNLAKDQLGTFVNDEKFLDNMKLAFGEDWRPQEARASVYDLASGRGEMPTIETLPAADLGGDGAFVEDTIYLSEEFLSENADNSQAVAGVLLEELGHYLDQELSRVDSPGDEGEIFAKLVQDGRLSGDELTALKAEDDRATIRLDGQEVPVELAAPEYPGYDLVYDPSAPEYDEDPEVVQLWQQRMFELDYPLTPDGDYGPESVDVATQFQTDQGLTVDGIVGPETWEASFTVEPPPVSDGSFIDNVVAKAYEEWELFDQGALTETEEGAWQRVGGYWQSVGEDLTGLDTEVPWSAAFISWVMQEAGASDSFEYNASHSYYIEDAVQNRAEGDTNAAFQAYRIDEYSPQVGDLVSYARQEGVDYDTPAPYSSHSDIVVAARPGAIDVIGGNVSHSVTQKTLEVDSEGRLIDTSADWFAVLRNRENPFPTV